MPFPYAYYKEEYNGSLHGTDIEAPVFSVTGLKTFSGSDVVNGVLDVTNKSVLSAVTTAGNIVIDGFSGGKEGQLLLIRKENQLNSLTIRFNSAIPGQVLISNISDLVFGNGRYGAALFIKGVNSWHHIDNIGFFGDGSALTPGLSFGSDQDTGIFRPGANILAFATAGIERLRISSTLITSALPVLLPVGLSTAPAISFSGDATTGFYKTSTSIAMSADGVPVLEFNKNGSLSMLSNSGFRADTAYQFSTSNINTPQAIRANSLLTSDVFTDSTQVPVNGIYSKGHIKTAGQFQGVATSAQFADLAERYESDKEYSVGTILKIGGSKEVTLCGAGDEPFGVISSKPGLMLNSNAGNDNTHPFIALVGKTPCRVIGKVEKGDKIVVADNGIGRAKKESDNLVSIGKALEDKGFDQEGFIMIATKAVF